MNDPTDAALARIRLMLTQHRYADAEQFAREALSQRPTDGEVLHLLSIALLHQDGRASEALDVVDAAIAQVDK